MVLSLSKATIMNNSFDGFMHKVYAYDDISKILHYAVHTTHRATAHGKYDLRAAWAIKMICETRAYAKYDFIINFIIIILIY